MFFVKNATGRWTFPKGKQQTPETLVETAIREIQEETGLTNLRYIAPIGSTMFRFRQEGVLIRKTVHYFLFEAPPDAKEQMKGLEGGMWEAAWVSLEKVFDVSSYRNLDRLLARALRMISQQSALLVGQEGMPALST
jgi:8-oxo-dGTP pyrophosphatase MutT (NUDIX family)